MRSLVLLCLVMPSLAAAAPVCKLRGAPWLEGRIAGSSARPSRAIDARHGQAIDVFLVASGTYDGKRVTFSDDGARAHRPWRDCDARVRWSRVEPRMQHTNTPAPNASIPVYANAVVLGPDHGKWIGYDRIEYFMSELPGGDTHRRVLDATPTSGAPRAEPWLGLGVMRLAATVQLDGDATRYATPDASDSDGMISARVLRYSFRSGDDFLGWLSSFYNVPYLFGSAGKGARNQAERYLGADCADILVAALRKSGVAIDYTSVTDLVDTLPKVKGPVRPGDLYALDYVGYDDLPRSWDHIVALVEDRGPDGKPDGKPGPEDLVADSGGSDGLKIAPLAEQGEVRVSALRPR
jgi:hypothetical protein